MCGKSPIICFFSGLIWHLRHRPLRQICRRVAYIGYIVGPLDCIPRASPIEPDHDSPVVLHLRWDISLWEAHSFPIDPHPGVFACNILYADPIPTAGSSINVITIVLASVTHPH